MAARTLFLDTHALFRLASNAAHAQAAQQFMTMYNYTGITCTLNYVEMHPHRRGWDAVSDFIASVPFCSAENIELLTEREVSHYPDPVSLRMGFCSGDTAFTSAELKDAILTHLQGKLSGFHANTQQAARQILDALRQDRDAFEAPEQNGHYSAAQRQTFLQIGVLRAVPPQYIGALRARVSKGEAIDITRFKSVYVQQLAIWLEYYEQGKVGKLSDVGDFVMLGYLPYVDEAILDKERVDLVRRINRTGVLGQQLQVSTLAEFLKVVGVA